MSKTNPKELFHKKFGAQLKKIRLEKGLSIREVELRGDIDRSILSKIENGSRNCTLYTLKKIADAMEVDMAEFFKNLGK
jgi:transcriptional regulator with XRE-family HTH domain